MPEYADHARDHHLLSSHITISENSVFQLAYQQFCIDQQNDLQALMKKNEIQQAQPSRSTGAWISLFSGICIGLSIGMMGFSLPAITTLSPTVTATIITISALLVLGVLMGKSHTYRFAIIGSAVGLITALVMFKLSYLLPLPTISWISPLAMTTASIIMGVLLLGAIIGRIYAYIQSNHSASSDSPQNAHSTAEIQQSTDAVVEQLRVSELRLVNLGDNALFQPGELRGTESTRSSELSSQVSSRRTSIADTSIAETSSQPLLSAYESRTSSLSDDHNAFDPQDSMQRIPIGFKVPKPAEKPPVPSRPSDFNVPEHFVPTDVFGQKDDENTSDQPSHATQC